MASQNSSKTREACEGSFPLLEYNFVHTDQLPQLSQTWQPELPLDQVTLSNPATSSHLDDPDISSGDEDDFELETNQEQGGIADDAEEEIEENHVNCVRNPGTSHGLPLVPDDFCPLEGENHLRSWRLPYDFGSGPRIDPPRGCTDNCTHDGHGENCANSAPDSGDSIEDRWDLPFLMFEQFFTKQVMETLASNTNIYAGSKNAGVPQTGHQTSRPWKETSPPELMIWLGLIIYMSVIRLTRVDEYWSKNGEWPRHCIMRFQGFNRFSNIKRFFHVSPPNNHLPLSRLKN